MKKIVRAIFEKIGVLWNFGKILVKFYQNVTKNPTKEPDFGHNYEWRLHPSECTKVAQGLRVWLRTVWVTSRMFLGGFLVENMKFW